MVIPLVVLIVVLSTTGKSFDATTHQISSLSSYVVTSSAYDTLGSNVYISTDTGYVTTQDFKECRERQATVVGLVMDQTDQTANDGLTWIFKQVNDALQAATGVNPSF